MDIKEYSGNMKIAVENILGEGYIVEEICVSKNNGVRLDALVIRKDEINLSPTIYLKHYYENYMDGESIKEGALRLVKTYYEVVPETNFDIDFFTEYENIRKGLAFKLISAERNTDLLTDSPHVPFLDLEIVFYYSLDKNGMDGATILVRNKHMDLWGVSTEDLMRDSMKNTPDHMPGRCRDMQSVLTKLYPGHEDELNDINDMPLMYVVTNDKMVYGAATMLYPGLIKSLSEKIGSDLYIIPSSVHELIVVPTGAIPDADYLRDMIYQVNHSQLEPQDILSDSLYFYDGMTEKISIAS